MRLLLDTHVVLWLMLGRRDVVPAEVAATIADPASEPMVSAASVWEIAIKRSLGKVTLPDGWLRGLHQLDLPHLPVTAQHAVGVERLPWHHRDPFDRLLVAQAQEEGATLVSADQLLRRYDVPFLWGTTA